MTRDQSYVYFITGGHDNRSEYIAHRPKWDSKKETFVPACGTHHNDTFAERDLTWKTVKSLHQVPLPNRKCENPQCFGD